MADEEEKSEVVEKKGGGMKIAVIVLAVLLLVGGSIGVTVFMLGGKTEKVEEQVPVPVEEVEVVVKPLYFNFDPPFVVNFADENHIRFLQVAVEVMTFDETVIEDIESFMPLFRNNLILLLSNVEYTKINNSVGINALRQDALVEVQNILEEKTGRKGIEELYFTNFVMQ